jgi:arylsulfatase B
MSSFLLLLILSLLMLTTTTTAITTNNKQKSSSSHSLRSSISQVLLHQQNTKQQQMKSTSKPTIPTANTKPHIIVLLMDDFGYNNVGYHAKDQGNEEETVTPNIDQLASTGLILERHYTYAKCGPSRSSLQSGRLPVHVSTINTAPESYNPNDPISGYSGIPRNMTCIAEKMKQAGYRTVMTGKWDAGMATPRHTPQGRGYDEFLGYFHHAVDYYTCGVTLTAIGEINVCLNQFTDLWLNDGPAPDNLTSSGTIYLEDTLLDHTLQAIYSHPPSVPLFLVHSFHLIHTPLQVPAEQLEKFTSYIDYENRAKYAAMVNYADTIIGNIVQALHDTNLYDNSLIVLFSDNGGPVYNPGSANNYPLRGGKYSDFEGGVRVNALVNGGVLPSSRRGEIETKYIHIADWYATFIRLATFGVSGEVDSNIMQELLYDDDAASADLPQVDSIDAWDTITGSSGSSSSTSGGRTEIHLSEQTLISGQYKLIVGNQTQVLWEGPFYPNATGQQPMFPDSPYSPSSSTFEYDCGTDGCLFDIFNDPTEHFDIADSQPEIRQTMLNRLNELNKSFFNPDRGGGDISACEIAVGRYDNHYGPFVEVPPFTVPHRG